MKNRSIKVHYCTIGLCVYTHLQLLNDIMTPYRAVSFSAPCSRNVSWAGYCWYTSDAPKKIAQHETAILQRVKYCHKRLECHSECRPRTQNSLETPAVSANPLSVLGLLALKQCSRLLTSEKFWLVVLNPRICVGIIPSYVELSEN
jgi:hypothetical protein